MPAPADAVKNQLELQLNVLLRLARISHCYTETLIARQLAAAREATRRLVVSATGNGKAAENWLQASGDVWLEHWKLCLHDGLDCQHQLLAELARK